MPAPIEVVGVIIGVLGAVSLIAGAALAIWEN